MSDRQLIKDTEKGIFRTVAEISDPNGAVEDLHEDVIKFDLDADASLAERGMRVDKAFKVKSVYFTPSTALAASGTDYTTYTVSKRDGAGGAAATVAATDTNSAGSNVSLAAFVPQALTLTTANTTFAAGNVITVKSAETGIPTSPLGCFTILVEYI